MSIVKELNWRMKSAVWVYEQKQLDGHDSFFRPSPSLIVFYLSWEKIRN